MLTTILLTTSIAWGTCQDSKPQTKSEPAIRVPAVPATAAQAPPADDPAVLEKKYQEKLKKAFLAAGPWKLDYDAARDEARQAGKSLFVYFTRSYAP
jgi:hypothetical protein